ncbi:Aspartokinase [Pseudozyma hubeiensis]|nr:Aspartokinase [Pseudozyma hubeiensis]
MAIRWDEPNYQALQQAFFVILLDGPSRQGFAAVYMPAPYDRPNSQTFALVSVDRSATFDPRVHINGTDQMASFGKRQTQGLLIVIMATLVVPFVLAGHAQIHPIDTDRPPSPPNFIDGELFVTPWPIPDHEFQPFCTTISSTPSSYPTRNNINFVHRDPIT